MAGWVDFAEPIDLMGTGLKVAQGLLQQARALIRLRLADAQNSRDLAFVHRHWSICCGVRRCVIGCVTVDVSNDI
jgi:hypothetical protein